MTKPRTQPDLAKLAFDPKQLIDEEPPRSTKAAFTLDEMTGEGDGSRSYLYGEIQAGRLIAHKRGRRTIVLAKNRQRWREAWPAIKPKAA